MATETIILRPTGGDCTEITVRYPDTLDIWELVNEEVADDDATYILISKSQDATLRFTFPEKYKNLTPSSMTIHYRAKAYNSTSTSTNISICYGDLLGTSFFKHMIGEKTTLSSIYQDYEINVSQDTLETVYSKLISTDDPQYNCLYLLSSTSNKNEELAQVTQFYLEITYEDEESSESMFIRQNGSWVELSGTIYKRQNGSWVLADSSALQNETHYILNDTTI
jgi:hypothetical protein